MGRNSGSGASWKVGTSEGGLGRSLGSWGMVINVDPSGLVQPWQTYLVSCSEGIRNAGWWFLNWNFELGISTEELLFGKFSSDQVLAPDFRGMKCYLLFLCSNSFPREMVVFPWVVGDGGLNSKALFNWSRNSVSPSSWIPREEHLPALEFHTHTISLKGRSLFRVPEVSIESPFCQRWPLILCIGMLGKPQDLIVDRLVISFEEILPVWLNLLGLYLYLCSTLLRKEISFQLQMNCLCHPTACFLATATVLQSRDKDWGKPHCSSEKEQLCS